MSEQNRNSLYIAPELFENENHYGTAVDVYSFAFLAYKIITGKDPKDRPSFEEFFETLSSIYPNLDPKIPIVLVGNIIDLVSFRKVTYEDGEKLALENGWRYFETSAKENRG